MVRFYLVMGRIVFKIADSKEELAARTFVSKKYFDAGYFNVKRSSIPFSDEYLKNSTYIIGKDNENRIIGTIRIIKNTPEGLPTLNEFDLFPKMKKYINRINLDKVVEVGNLAAEKGSGVAFELYKKSLVVSNIEGYKYWVASIDRTFYNGLKKKYKFIGLFIKEIGQPKHYVGSISVPVIIPLLPLILYSYFISLKSKPGVFNEI